MSLSLNQKGILGVQFFCSVRIESIGKDIPNPNTGVSLHSAWKELPVKGHSSLVGKAWSQIHLGILESCFCMAFVRNFQNQLSKACRRVNSFA